MVIRHFVLVAFVSMSASAALAANLEHGKGLYEECSGCHALTENLVGPKHCGVMGRKAGSLADFVYSDVMKEAPFRWDAKHLNDFLASPLSYLSGTNMGYAGLYDAKDREDLIAYLEKLTNDPVLCDPRRAPAAAAK